MKACSICGEFRAELVPNLGNSAILNNSIQRFGVIRVTTHNRYHVRPELHDTAIPEIWLWERILAPELRLRPQP